MSWFKAAITSSPVTVVSVILGLAASSAAGAPANATRELVATPHETKRERGFGKRFHLLTAFAAKAAGRFSAFAITLGSAFIQFTNQLSLILHYKCRSRRDGDTPPLLYPDPILLWFGNGFLYGFPNWSGAKLLNQLSPSRVSSSRLGPCLLHRSAARDRKPCPYERGPILPNRHRRAAHGELIVTGEDEPECLAVCAHPLRGETRGLAGADIPSRSFPLISIAATSGSNNFSRTGS